MSWIGGKMALRELIVSLFPIQFERYIEVFGGGGWVLFHKKPSRVEVYNDFNGLLANLYRCVREKPEQLKESLRYVLNSREDFGIIKEALARDSPMSDVQRASYFYQLIRYSYASGLTSYASQPHDMWANFPLIDQAHQRIRNVLIENKECVKLIQQYDRPFTEDGKGTLFYCDPPYYATEGYYQNIGEDGFTEADHIRLRDALLLIEGKFLLSYNDCAFVRELYDAPGIHIMETSRINNIKQRYDGGCRFSELLIANYDMHGRSRLAPEQMNLFEQGGFVA